MAKAKRTSRDKLTSRTATTVLSPDRLLGDIRSLIESAREQTARAVKSALVGLYWHIGKRIREDVLGNDRADYGKQVVNALSSQLSAEYGRGFSRSNLFAMLQFADAFPDVEIVQTLSGQLSWSHFLAILPLEDRLKRDFYAEMCRIERWSVRTLRHKIGHLLFERTAVAKKPEELIEQDLAALRDEDRMTPDLVFRDPYFLDFLGLTGQYIEKNMDASLLADGSSPQMRARVAAIFCSYSANR